MSFLALLGCREKCQNRRFFSSRKPKWVSGYPSWGGYQKWVTFWPLFWQKIDQKWPILSRNGSFMDRFTREYILACGAGGCPDGPQKSRFFKNHVFGSLPCSHDARTRARPSNMVSATVRGPKMGPFLGHFLNPFFDPFLAILPRFSALNLEIGGPKKGHFGGHFWPIFGPPYRGGNGVQKWSKRGHFGTFWHFWKRVIFGVILDTPLKPPYFR